MNDKPIRAVLTLSHAPWGRQAPSGPVSASALQVNLAEVNANGVGSGYRLIGPKLAGVSVPLVQAELDARDAAEIIRIIDAAFPKLAASLHDGAGRLSRIAEAHHKFVTPTGMTSGTCAECDQAWPCPTYVWASGAGREVSATWDPADDAVVAAARTAVPELAAEVRRLRAELDETRRLVAAWLYAANSGWDTDPGSLQGAFMLSDRDLAPELDAIEAAREA
jgi:hypothetical protein